jgi:hypothetical protein
MADLTNEVAVNEGLFYAGERKKTFRRNSRQRSLKNSRKNLFEDDSIAPRLAQVFEHP